MSASARPARCSACRLARSSVPVETRACTNCGILIRANTVYIRCEVCRQAARLHTNQRQPSGDIQRCLECGDDFAAHRGVKRCFRCRSRRANPTQPATDFSQSAASSFNPSVNSFQRVYTRRQVVQANNHFLEPPTRSIPSDDCLRSVILWAERPRARVRIPTASF